MHEARHILAKFFVNSVVWTVLCENVGWQNILPKAEVRITKRFDWHYYTAAARIGHPAGRRRGAGRPTRAAAAITCPWK